MARFRGFGKTTSNAQNFVAGIVNRAKGFNNRSAALLAVLISAPILTIGLVRADNANQNTEDIEVREDNLHELQNPAQENATDKQIIEQNSGSSAKVNITRKDETQGSSNVSVKVDGSITTTDENGDTRTETFEKNYTNDTGAANNNFSVNVTAGSESKTRVKISNDSDVDVRMRDSSSFEIE